jgi:hypothetical protein
VDKDLMDLVQANYTDQQIERYLALKKRFNGTPQQLPLTAAAPPAPTLASMTRARPESAQECMDRVLPDSAMVAAPYGHVFLIPTAELRAASHNSKFKRGERTDNHCRADAYGTLKRRVEKLGPKGRSFRCSCPAGSPYVAVTKVREPS